MREAAFFGLTAGLLLHVNIAVAQPLAPPICPSALLTTEAKQIADASAARIASQAASYRIDEAISILSSQLRAEVRLRPPSVGLPAANAQLDRLDRQMIAVCWPGFETALRRIEAVANQAEELSANSERRVNTPNGSTGFAGSEDFSQAQARMLARSQRQREEDELAVHSSSARNSAIAAATQRQYAERIEGERLQRELLQRERQTNESAVVAQNRDAKEDPPGYGEGALKVYDQLFIGILECNKRGWAFTDGDIADFKNVGTERFSHIAQGIRDRIWTEVETSTQRRDGNKSECDEFRRYLRTYLPLLMPGTPPMFAPPAQPLQKSPF